LGLYEPSPITAELGVRRGRFVHNECRRPLPQGLQGEKTRLVAVHQFEALRGVGQGGRREIVELDLTQRDQLLGLRSALLADALPPDPSLAPVVQKLFDERNVKMLAKIEGYLNSNGSYFVIVGAGHLVGKRGLVELLKSKGYAVEQL